MLRNILILATIFLLAPHAAGAQSALPDGAGKAIVQSSCASCHALSQVTNAGHSKAEWDTVLHMMVNAGAQLPADQFETVSTYLAKNFPPKTVGAAALISGPVKVTITEWDVPTPGSRPHDPMYAPDGSAWYTGQMANVLGRFDPRTQQFREFKLPENSGPHGLIPDHDGNVWYTANFGAYIGKLDPRTGAVKQYPMPDPAAKDPHTLLLAPNGNIYFTVQGANRVGRLDPKTGEVKLVTSPTPRSNPYGMVIDSHGAPFFVEFGSNKVARLDPDTLAIHEFVLPHADSRPRRVAITPDDIIWYSDYARGYLGRLDPKTGAVTEFPSPGGKDSRPYGITAVGDVIWYSESNVSPNTLVRFDPKTQKFESWAIPSGGGVVRNMVHTPEGNLWLACSGVNKIAFVEVEKDRAAR
ncbi:MAG: cytochrome C [Alphaproteobacteria bacterium]|nr:cytochrome C [Alphaproteobacteria bacterium]